ncbi:phosphatase PAP2 family protein [Agrobacterium rosae]|uniref:phosphatase PAP2 family protein n=1 Tax=Agrobacterium rosae TaxID=1972867 RepID=UPI003A80F331
MMDMENGGIANRTTRRDFNKEQLLLVCALIVLTSAIFAASPELDIAFSRLFFDGQKFPLSQNTSLQKLRSLTELIGAIILGGCLVLICYRPLREFLRLRVRDLFVPFIAYGVGTGLIVNSILKQYIGRARPRSIEEFGGSDVFTGVWELSDACHSNCSFTSGEAAGAMAMCSVLILIPKGPARTFAFITMTFLSALLGLNRIAFGAHFLSDVLLSMLIITAIILAAKILLRGRDSKNNFQKVQR